MKPGPDSNLQNENVHYVLDWLGNNGSDFGYCYFLTAI